jgi:hypothetical protein
MRKPGQGRPFNFVHDINAIYFRFYTHDWFYNDPGYSDEFVARNGWKFDGQVFYRKKESKDE